MPLKLSPGINTALKLGRVSNLPTVWMNVIASLALTSAALGLGFPLATSLLIIIALSCFYAGGMCFNDYCDRHWDAERQPFRPIPAGAINARAVLTLSLALFASGLVVLWLAPNSRGVLGATGLLALIIAYDLWHKRHWATVLLMASTRLGVYIVAALALTGSASQTVILLGLIQCGYTLLVTVVARLESRYPKGYGFAVIPWMIAGMGLIDGVALAVLLSPMWLLAGIATVVLTRWGQRYVRGD
ncbi:UbiA family prenyltransferase [Gilvimarinus polysaccharolyticus]|uniref:UbiA family prenyltransferase n=1 Tax=Gilvimarinus polysaccharolyticus TaxID=863921 RepID=UPI000673ADEA|nr:UbiA family prenyltransferase [Gilvimarinus polysaccharolyticus]